MTNRIQHLLHHRAESPRDDEFFVVSGEFGQVYVSRETAHRLRTVLARFLPPRWVAITTLTGSVISVRGRHINTIAESTREQRAAARRFWRAREQEEAEEDNRRPW